MLLFGYCHKAEDQTLFQTRIYSIGETKWFPLKEVTFIYLCVCVCLLAYECVCHVVYVEVRVQLAEISSLFPQCGSQGSNPRHQVWHQPLPSEPSHHPTNMVLFEKLPNRFTPLPHYSRSHVPSPKSAIAGVTKINISPWPESSFASVTNSLT